MAEEELDPYANFKQRDFRTYYGTQAFTPPGVVPGIHKLIQDLRFAIGGIKAEKRQGVMFPVKSAADLMNKLSQALQDHNAIAPVVHSEFHHSPFSWTNKEGKTGVGSMIHCKSVVRLCADDGSYIDLVGSGHGQDRDDKAGGKASTYAWKDALLKGLSLGEENVEDTDNYTGTGNGAATVVRDSAPVVASAPAAAQAAEAPKRRGRPPGSGKKQQEAAQSAPAGSVATDAKPTNAPQDQFILDTIKKLESAKSLEEVYRIRDEEIKPKDAGVQKALTPAYVKARDAHKAKA